MEDFVEGIRLRELQLSLGFTPRSMKLRLLILLRDGLHGLLQGQRPHGGTASILYLL